MFRSKPKRADTIGLMSSPDDNDSDLPMSPVDKAATFQEDFDADNEKNSKEDETLNSNDSQLVRLQNFASSGNADFLDPMDELHKGTALKLRNSHWYYYQVSNDNTRLQWYSNAKALSETFLYLNNFQSVKTMEDESNYRKTFCITYGGGRDISKKKELILECKTPLQCKIWMETLGLLVNQIQGDDKEKSNPIDTSSIRVTVNDYYINGAYIYADAQNAVVKVDDKQFATATQLCNSDLIKCIDNIRYVETLLLKNPELANQTTVKLKIKEIRERADKLQKMKDIENPTQTLEYIKMLNIECLALQEKSEVLLSYLGKNRVTKTKKNGLFGFF